MTCTAVVIGSLAAGSALAVYAAVNSAGGISYYSVALRALDTDPNAANPRQTCLSERVFHRALERASHRDSCMKISTFPVLTRRNVLMQRVLDNVTRGYWHHTSGTVAAPRAFPMVEKFCDR
jgi:hypothetical protein